MSILNLMEPILLIFNPFEQKTTAAKTGLLGIDRVHRCSARAGKGLNQAQQVCDGKQWKYMESTIIVILCHITVTINIQPAIQSAFSELSRMVSKVVILENARQVSKKTNKTVEQAVSNRKEQGMPRARRCF